MNRLLSLFVCASLGAASLAAAADVYKWTDDKGVVHYGDAPPEGFASTRIEVREAPAPTPVAEPSTAPGAAEAAKTAAATNTSNCDLARRNLEVFGSAAAVTMDRDGDGKPEPLDETQRTEELTRNQELVRIYCKEDPAADEAGATADADGGQQ
jgi:hypothetical protein